MRQCFLKESYFWKLLLVALFVSVSGSGVNLCTLGTRLQSADSLVIRQVYRSILMDSRPFVDLVSFDQALLQGDPFALSGEVHLFADTAQALLLLRKHIIDSFTEKEVHQIEETLLSELSSLAPKDGRQSVNAAYIARIRSGLRAPLSVETEVPDVFTNLAAARYSLDGKYLITVSGEGEVRTYRRNPTGFLLHYSTEPFIFELGARRPAPGQCLYPIALSPDGRYFAIVAPLTDRNDGPFVFEIETGKRIRSFEKCNDGRAFYTVTNLQFSPDSRYLAASGRGGDLGITVEDTKYHLWSMDGHLRPRISFSAGSIKGGKVAFSLDSRFFFHALNGIHFYDLKEGFELIPHDHRSSLRPTAIPRGNAVTAHPSKTWVAIQTVAKTRNKKRPWMGKLYLLDYGTLTERYGKLQNNPTPGQPRFRKTRISSLPVLELQTKQSKSTPEWSGLVFSPNGRYLASGFQDGKFRFDTELDIFEIKETLHQSTPEPIVTLKLPAALRKMEFSNDGRYFLLITHDKIHVYNVPGFDLVDIISPAVTRIFDFTLTSDRRHILTVEDDEGLIERNFFYDANEEALRVLQERSTP